MKELEKDMTPRLIEDLGILRRGNNKGAYRYGLYECQYCGKEFEAQSNNIKHGLKSCGCQRKGINKTHGLESNRFYQTWYGMMGRCYNLKNKHYQNYGGRGISVCTDWQDLANFVSWAEETYIEGMTMDRINNDGNYEPTNIRWADKTTQALNKRTSKSNTSGFVGVSYYKKYNKWSASITIDCKVVFLGYFKIKEEAVQARDNYIIENKLPHPLSTQY